jgi:hypothetical protein
MLSYSIKICQTVAGIYYNQSISRILGSDDNVVDSDYYMDPDLPEAEPLWHMSQSKDHRPLLAHPVITSFLCLKWRRIRPYFYTNLVLYSLFLVCLTSYLLMMTLNKVPSIYHVITLRVQKCSKMSKTVQKM